MSWWSLPGAIATPIAQRREQTINLDRCLGARRAPAVPHGRQHLADLGEVTDFDLCGDARKEAELRKRDRSAARCAGVESTARLSGRGRARPGRGWSLPSSGLGEGSCPKSHRSRSAADDLVALRFGQPAPDPVGLLHRQGVPAALLENRAALADLLGPSLPPDSRRTALALGMEEEGAVHASASAPHLPVPDVGHRNGKSARVCHLHHFTCRSGRAACGQSTPEATASNIVHKMSLNTFVAGGVPVAAAGGAPHDEACNLSSRRP